MFNSIRIKLTILYTLVFAAFMIAIAAVVYFAVIRTLDGDLNRSLVEMSNNFATGLRAEEEESKDEPGSDPIKEAADEMRFRDYLFSVYAPEGKPLATTADFEIPFIAGGSDRFSDLEAGGKHFRVFQTGIPAGNQAVFLCVAHSLDEQAAMTTELFRIFLVGLPLTLLFAAACGYFLARRTLAPMVEMGRQAGGIGARNMDERLVVVNRNDELGQLADVFNKLLERLDDAFKQQRRFMADASHELRTPLAIVRGESEVALSRTDRALEDYRESLAIVHDESKRLTRIVDDLFTLARADAGQFKPKFVPVYLDEIVSESARSMAVLARRKNIDLEVVSCGEMPMKADEPLLHRLFLNLLDNAVKYGRENGSVKINCLADAERYCITIEDDGCGISCEERPRIFERFYRVDKARTRGTESETSGAGLGLSIAQWIAEIHNGRIDLVSSSEGGSVFSVVFIHSE